MGTNSINSNMLTGPVYGLATTLPARKLTGSELPWLMPYGTFRATGIGRCG
jgi:hypothetical protein